MKKENEATKCRMVWDIRNLFGQKKEDYYRPVRVGNFWSRNYIEYESNNDKTKTLSIGEYLNKIRPSLKDIINNLKSLIHGKLLLKTMKMSVQMLVTNTLKIKIKITK